MKTNYKKRSKFLSLILRHNPGKIGLQLDEQGWANVDELLLKISADQSQWDLQLLKDIVANNDKKRFAFNDDETKIRASQGHSLEVDLDYVAKEPPEYLYHGTVAKFMDAIIANGLQKMNRHHVHLSEERDTAIAVGARRGKPVILTIRSGEMYRDGMTFFQSANGVWLTDTVSPKYLDFKN